MIMEQNLNYECSDKNRRAYTSTGYGPYIENITEGNLQISRSNKHINIDDIGNIGSQKLICENSTGFNSNHDINNMYDSVNVTNLYLDSRESGSLSTIRRSSMRGRRRYRRTLLRNYEQPLGQNSHGNHLYLEQCDGIDLNHQKRLYLKNPNIGVVNGGINYSSFKFNNNFDNYSKTSKPSWDGGRLVKLLQGHGLNIEDYEKENEYHLNKNWSSKQVNNKNNQLGCMSNNKEVNTSTVVSEQKYVQLSQIDCGVNLQLCEISDQQKIIGTKYLHNFPPYTNNRSDSFKLCQKDDILIREGSPLSRINNMEKQISMQDRLTEGDTISNESFETPRTDQFSLVSSFDNQSLVRPNQNIEDNNHLIGTNYQNSSSSFYGNPKELYVNSERNYGINSTIPSVEKREVSIINQHLFNTEEHEGELASHLSYYSFNPSFYNISHEELFVTLGDTPTSKSSYNLSTLFVPNQDS
ncbi:uncharacterized protein cubi_00156 [Cryptosporidium ubiquitum]|uniref:Uncharacterized protein n=1 Tax=Cryptosporidium ubiquitum TaxID=857276 RepID=A0A1J4MMB6_9CRYT|nr:uncharacterized protein cubi_00156 [Cryptosporidium ubiquitum]OII74603.1 hypothetical protein cubi_00156 [Cryptosporidium ubiquitum]